MLDDKQIVFFVNIVPEPKDLRVFTHDRQLLHGRIDFSLFDDHAERISHDCDEHIEHGDLRHKSRHKEENVAEVPLWIIIEVIHLELSQCKHILVQDRVDNEYIEDRRNNCVFLCFCIQREHKHGAANHAESSNE